MVSGWFHLKPWHTLSLVYSNLHNILTIKELFFIVNYSA